MVKQVVHIASNETNSMDLMEYMDYIIKKVIPKILQLPGIVKADITKLTHMNVKDGTQVEDKSNVSLQAQVYYESEEAYRYIISNVIDEDLMRLLHESENYISLYSGYQYSFQKY